MTKSLIALMMILSLGLAETSRAQQFGIGMYGGMQACVPGGGGAPNIPDGITDVDDDISDVMQSQRDANAELRELRRDLREYRGDITEAEKQLGILHEKIRPHVITHIKSQWPSAQVPDPVTDCEDGKAKAGKTMPWTDYCKDPGTDTEKPDNQSFARIFADSVLGKGRGEVDPTKTCSFNNALREQGKGIAESQKAACARAMQRLGQAAQKLSALELREQELIAQVDFYKERMKELRRERREAVRDAERDARDGISTQAGFCYRCQYPNDRPVDTVGKVGSLVLGGLGAYLGYRGARHISDQNTNLGWPTSPYLSAAMTLPSVMYGIYGATYGGGAGGCAGGGPGPYGMMGPGGAYGSGLYPQMGGAFGYPGGFGGMMGGGLYNPGMGPWGVPGPWGGGGGFPGGFGVPMSGGFPMTGGIVGAIGGGIVGMYSGGGIVPFAPIGGMMMPGIIAPMSGMMVGGIAGGIVGLMAPMSGMGMMTGMIAPYSGMGMIGGGVVGMMAPYGMGMMTGMMAPMGGNFGGMGLQYQQMLLQQQMQQQQAWIQQQQQQQQDYQVRTQLVGRLQTQLVQIQTQIQQIMMGGFGSGMYGGGGGGVLPYPNQMPFPGQRGNFNGFDPNFPNPNQGPGPSRGGR